MQAEEGMRLAQLELQKAQHKMLLAEAEMGRSMLTDLVAHLSAPLLSRLIRILLNMFGAHKI
jgi:hypothetical protein